MAVKKTAKHKKSITLLSMLLGVQSLIAIIFVVYIHSILKVRLINTIIDILASNNPYSLIPVLEPVFFWLSFPLGELALLAGITLGILCFCLKTGKPWALKASMLSFLCLGIMQFIAIIFYCIKVSTMRTIPPCPVILLISFMAINFYAFWHIMKKKP